MEKNMNYMKALKSRNTLVSIADRSIQALFLLQTIPVQRVRTRNIHRLCEGTFMSNKNIIAFSKETIAILFFNDDIGI
jgi:hypothetical protein